MADEQKEWRAVTISYAVRPGMDTDFYEDAMIDAALDVLGCNCEDELDGVCAAGDWVASARPVEVDDG